MRALHENFAWLVIVANGLAGCWALGAHRVATLRHPTLWWFTGVAQVAIFVQAGLGAYLVAVDDIEVEQFHMFYGFVALAAVGIIYSYRQQLREHQYLLYGGGGLFLMGLGIRALFLG